MILGYDQRTLRRSRPSRSIPRFCVPGIALAFAFVWLSGCASSVQQADRFFDDRFYTDAASAYTKIVHESGTKVPPVALERSLFRLAMLHFLPQSPVYDMERGRELLKELIDRFDSGPYRAQAAVILDLDQRERRLQGEAASRRRQVAEIEQASSEDAAGLRSTAAKLRQDLERVNGEIAECREQLEKLKAIDLGDS